MALASFRNRAGTPNTAFYNLGRGKVYLAPLTAAGQMLGLRELGNARAFSTTMNMEELTHQSSQTGLKITDKSIILSQEESYSFTLDEFSDENLAEFFSATMAQPANPTIAGFAATPICPAGVGNLQMGVWYNIINSAGQRAMDITAGAAVAAGEVIIKTTAGAPVTLVQGDDYILDALMGRIFIVYKTGVSIVGTAIAANEGLTAVVTAKAGAKKINEVNTLKTTPTAKALVFISENPASDGKKREFIFFQTVVKASGDLALISDDWSQMTFEGKGETSNFYSGAMRINSLED